MLSPECSSFLSRRFASADANIPEGPRIRNSTLALSGVSAYMIAHNWHAKARRCRTKRVGATPLNTSRVTAATACAAKSLVVSMPRQTIWITSSGVNLYRRSKTCSLSTTEYNNVLRLFTWASVSELRGPTVLSNTDKKLASASDLPSRNCCAVVLVSDD